MSHSGVFPKGNPDAALDLSAEIAGQYNNPVGQVRLDISKSVAKRSDVIFAGSGAFQLLRK